MPQIQMRSAWWSYPDAQLMQQAGLNVFHRLFSDAGPAATVDRPSITIVLKGDSSLNPTLNEYYANATATVFSGADTYAMPIAVFNGNGKASQSNYSRSGILEAYEAAFAQIATDLLADKQLLARFQAKPRKRQRVPGNLPLKRSCSRTENDASDSGRLPRLSAVAVADLPDGANAAPRGNFPRGGAP
jgi:hypothetical protein